LFQRSSGIFFLENDVTRKQESLRTRDKATAKRILHARNEAHLQPAINLQIARAYLMVSDPGSTTRTRQSVMGAVAQTKDGGTRKRWERAMMEHPFDDIRRVKLIETRPDHFLGMFAKGTVCTNIFLRRLHNFALDMDWLPKAIMPHKQWPKIKFKDKRGITKAEHEKVLAGERNSEWRAYFNLLWHLGGSQSEVAHLRAEDVDWEMKVISFNRMKTGSVVQLHFADTLANLLNDLPCDGFKLPRIAKMKESDRAKAFSRRCNLVGVSGVSLHSYRYAWAERARTCGYPERFAMENLGHGSNAVAHAYAKKAHVMLPSLEEYEKTAADKNLTRSLFPLFQGGSPGFSDDFSRSTCRTENRSDAEQVAQRGILVSLFPIPDCLPRRRPLLRQARSGERCAFRIPLSVTRCARS
jgi:integrase